MRDIAPRLPPIAEQMEACEAILRGASLGQWPVRAICDGAGFAARGSRYDADIDTECVKVGEGVWLLAGTMRLGRPLAIWSRNRGGISIDIAVRGGWQFGFDDASSDLVTVSSGYASVTLLGQDTHNAWLPFVGVPNEYVCLLIGDEAAARAFGLKLSDLGSVLGELPTHQVSRSRSYVIEAGADMLHAARSIRHAPLSGASRFLYIKAKVYELLAHLTTCRRVSNAALECHASSAADDASVAALAVSAMGDCTTTLDLRSLARELGVTKNRLVQAFKTTYGTTPFQYATRARLARGRELLLEGRMSLIDIALACGYEHHSSFTTAYRRTYGETPRQTRLRARRNRDSSASPGPVSLGLKESHTSGQLA